MIQQGDSSAKPSNEAPQPAQASTPTEFTEALRALRAWSGLTYRQLERTTTARQDSTLPASTIASTLGRASLPRAQFVEAFTRACGLDDEHVHQWLEAHRRITRNEPAPAMSDDHDSDGSDTRASTPEVRRRWRGGRLDRPVAMVVAAVFGAAVALGVDSLLTTPTSPPASSGELLPASTESSGTLVTGLRILAVGSWAHIHPARTPEMCVTEGKDRDGRYPGAIAVQRPCAEAVPPRVFIEPVGKGVIQIQWHNPSYNIGCLTVIPDGPVRNLLEPRNDCAETNPAQQFRIETVGPTAAAHFRIRPVISEQCLSLRGHDTEPRAEIVQERCSGVAAQEFLIETTLPPATAPDPKAEGR